MQIGHCTTKEMERDNETAMDSDTDLIKTKYQGTMDDGNIRKEICDVMEGTQNAFEMRAKKYHFRIVE